jgi:hypothetical protein
VLLVSRGALTWREGKPHVARGKEWVEVDLGPCDVAACIVLSGLAEGDSLAAVALGGVG